MPYVQRAPRTLTDAEVAALLRVTGEHRAGFRDHVLFALALGTGLREHECLALNCGDVFASGEGTPRRRVQLRVFKASNPNPNQQIVHLPDPLRRKLARLRKNLKRDGRPVGANDPIFVSRRSRRLSDRMAREAFKTWQRRAGFDDPLFHFHALRHTACTALYRRTLDLTLVQRFARHASITSTMIYTAASDEDLRRAVADQPC